MMDDCFLDFDFTNTDWVNILNAAKACLSAHPHWRQLRGTPLENDLPVFMAEFALRVLEANVQDNLNREVGE